MIIKTCISLASQFWTLWHCHSVVMPASLLQSAAKSPQNSQDDEYAFNMISYLNRKAEEHFEWAQAHPKYGLLIAAALLALWLVGLLLHWKWATHWTFNGKLWFFDDCKPETRRRILIVLVSIALIGCVSLFFIWR